MGWPLSRRRAAFTPGRWRWSDRELERAGRLAHDIRIAHALRSADTHGLAEVMAAGPQLLTDWQDAFSAGPRTPGPDRRGPGRTARATAGRPSGGR
ncbi:hypothetical protein [Dactylosporangium sp. CA-139066]|uniref:hypothetical protein n=1 Tax=Dactylosporangium sp. CA-139066 TaxID=3239930 RepID=UPI003D8B82A7